MTNNTLKNCRLLVLTSTLPRWEGDNTPKFVYNHSKLLSERVGKVIVLAPHFENAKSQEKISPNFFIQRIKYFYPYKYENIFYDGGAGNKFSLSLPYLIKLCSYLFILFLNICIHRPGKNTVININWILPQGPATILANKIFFRSKIIATVRGSDIYSFNDKISTLLKRFVLKNSDVVVVNSDAMEEACYKVYRRNYLQRPTGYDDEVFYKKDINNKKTNILKLIAVGRLSEEKGFIYLLKAMKVIADENVVKFHLKIAGSGPELAKLQQYTKENNLNKHVELIGWVDHKDLPTLYREADLFVGTSIITKSGRREAFGNVYLESMACGTPVIVSDSAGASQMIENKVNGFIVKSKSVTDIVATINYVYSNPKQLEKISRNAEKTSLPFSTSKTRDFYVKILSDFGIE